MIVPLLWIAFFVSGVAGLSYELLWVRYLTHVFGATTPAVAATVAMFFAGTALGSALGARIFDRTARPVRAYAMLEATIGLVALVQPLAFGLLEDVLSSRGGAQSTLELLMASSLVLVPAAALLGATFPAMAAAVRGLANPTRATGLLYGLNTLGAVVGCVLVSFWWIPAWGLPATSRTLALCNLAIAAVVWLGVRASAADDRVVAADVVLAPPAPEADELLPWRRAAWLAAIGGFVSIAIEVQWVRALALSFPGTVYEFALVLAAYLVGIGLGGLWTGRRYRRVAPRRIDLLVAYAVAGGGAWVALNLLPHVAPWTLERLANDGLRSWGAYMAWVGGASVLVMLPATLAMGATLPILIGLATSRAEEVARTAGRLYGVNTLGGVVGSLAGTFVLMPSLGLSRSLAVLALGYLTLSLAVGDRRLPSRARLGLGAAVALGGVVVAVDLQPELNPFKERPGSTILFYEDAASATVAVYDDDSSRVRTLTVNNQYTLSETSAPTVALQYRLGVTALALHPQPKSALLIGFATGTTLAAMAEHPTLQQLRCVEIHDLVFELAPLFAGVNRNVADNPKVDLVRGDGRRYLARAGESYDVIVADLFVPRNPGVGALYSREHFEAVSRHLAPGGVFVTWLPLWQLGAPELASVARTFTDVFGDAQAFAGNATTGSPVLGLVTGVPVDRDGVGVDVSPLMAEAFGPAAADLSTNRHFARRVLTHDQLVQLAGDAPDNRLDHPVVEYGAPRSTMRARVTGHTIAADNLGRIAEISGRPW